MLTDCLYQASATATGGREGQASTSDGSLHVWLDLPAELGGRGHGNNPEQLFATGYAACFLSTMKTLKNQGHALPPSDARVTATVGLGPRPEGGFGLAITLLVSLPGMDPNRAQALMEAAHGACPYSRAIAGNVPVHLSLA
ncbi:MULTISPECIES: organic hydroperoxide resistance protein [unclassified Novosphingobium]|uniref:organic hydroperoxide resistance protein n=1 Tax=Novosphingobium TaxID=165696 RepID=UPI00144784A3|nr:MULTISPECIES: organic hydroperoxide resistance protein [unclassified Novosphingobium]NKJ40923.1 Ohr subfamily peroxiredoxin [Novosphingobium sp. SG720]NMN03168.1 Ohr subfamily peroxiredoxin [Novosphingobium sp. SG919]NMN86842.1 Ohr subfamily peroxiredoxin [Novosphingobium sp. SG916]